MQGMKKHISMPGLLEKVQEQFRNMPEKSGARSKMPLADCLMSGLAIFSLKMPSLLQFEDYLSQEHIAQNIKTLYGIGQVPCDTYSAIPAQIKSGLK